MAGNKHYIAVFVMLAGTVAVCGAILGPPSYCPTADQVQQALDDLRQGHYPKAEREALAITTNTEEPNPRAWAIVGAARQRSKQYRSAAEAYRQFLAETDCPRSRSFAMEQIQACAAAAKTPTPPPAPPSKRLNAATLAGLAKVSKQTYAESTEHFIVRANNAALAKIVANEAEDSLDRICRVILAGQDYPHCVNINIWPNRSSFRAHAVDAPEWAGGGFSYSCENGLITRRIDLTQLDAKGNFATVMLDRVLPHEMCHLVVKELFGDAQCPLFLNEGLAMMAEYEPENSRIRLAGRTVAGQGPQHLENMFLAQRYDVENPVVFYAESFSFVEFLHERLSTSQFRDFLGNVQAGCTVTDAIQRSLYMPASATFTADLANAWEDHALAQAQYLDALAAADTQ